MSDKAIPQTAFQNRLLANVMKISLNKTPIDIFCFAHLNEDWRQFSKRKIIGKLS